ncbi:(2Fe-2S)-binding protein [Chelatococcus daeguensis]|uniref:2Fe-2S iron-sulfur cluster binding domain n=1 Tax=Chelatococcus sambhunathii TaxID=363953 RepID=A0ABP2A5F9_9HYPH|nr:MULTISPECIES: (2Fe-2S)-binding protein [Chelatococcus]KZE36587.1 ferredoxin [Chelatococcus daeguensis]MBM3082193.1 (2Fe-2S)-binding protein [Chelatococcus daeguensis]CUA85891.1 2Fe-2S iron-sulfur cluster binding domain [Chelatococcus sambhunathii]
MSLFHRIARSDHAPVRFLLDGVPCEGREGDTLLTAILTHVDKVRVSDFSGAPRAGFCQIGVCQDCWVTLADGERVRACTTPLTAGMSVVTGAAA